MNQRAERSGALPSSLARAPRRARAGAQPQLRPPALPAPGYAASLRTPAPDAVLAEYRPQRGGAPDAALAQAPEEPEGDVRPLRRGVRDGLAFCPDCSVRWHLASSAARVRSMLSAGRKCWSIGCCDAAAAQGPHRR